MINQTAEYSLIPLLLLFPLRSLALSLFLPDGINAKLRAEENQREASEASKPRKHSSYLLLFTWHTYRFHALYGGLPEEGVQITLDAPWNTAFTVTWLYRRIGITQSAPGTHMDCLKSTGQTSFHNTHRFSVFFLFFCSAFSVSILLHGAMLVWKKTPPSPG